MRSRLAAGSPLVRRKLLQDVLGGFDELCSLPNQPVTAPGLRGMDRTRNREYFPALLACQASRDQGPALDCRLDNQYTLR